VNAAYDVGYVRGEFPVFWCNNCSKETIYPRCDSCKGLCVKKVFLSD
jgi:predicted RNA-binding protein with PUA domain